MIYVDTSSLLKLVLPDDQTLPVLEALKSEELVIVSALTNLEFQVQLRALLRGGGLRPGQMRRVAGKLSSMLESAPYVSRPLSGSIFAVALEQHERTTVHCRSLDRLHLAAMVELGVQRLMTHDRRQATAATELGYEVISPGL